MKDNDTESKVTASQRFLTLYHDLPKESQRRLVEEKLGKLLDELGADNGFVQDLLTHTSTLTHTLRPLPSISMTTYHSTLTYLLSQLSLFSKLSSMPSSSSSSPFTSYQTTPPLPSLLTSLSHSELVHEYFRTLATWMEDVWVCVWVWRERYLEGHECLLEILRWARRVLDIPGLGSPGGGMFGMGPGSGCGCAIVNCRIVVRLRVPRVGPFDSGDPAVARDMKGSSKRQRKWKTMGDVKYEEEELDPDSSSLSTTVKTFHLHGPQQLNSVLLWIWRDLFVSMAAYGSRESRGKGDRTMREMVEDVEEAIGENGGGVEGLVDGGYDLRNPEIDDDMEDLEDQLDELLDLDEDPTDSEDDSEDDSEEDNEDKDDEDAYVTTDDDGEYDEVKDLTVTADGRSTASVTKKENKKSNDTGISPPTPVDEDQWSDRANSDSSSSSPSSSPVHRAKPTPPHIHKPCTCPHHAPYWSQRQNTSRLVLYHLVMERLKEKFETRPSLSGWRVIGELARHVGGGVSIVRAAIASLSSPQTTIPGTIESPEVIERWLTQTLERNQGNSRETVKAALRIWVYNFDVERARECWRRWGWMLNGEGDGGDRDVSMGVAVVLPAIEQKANTKTTEEGKGKAKEVEVAPSVTLAGSETPPQPKPLTSLTVFESELTASIASLIRAVTSTFGLASTPLNLTELQNILKLPANSQQRKDRIDSWVERVLSPSLSSGIDLAGGAFGLGPGGGPGGPGGGGPGGGMGPGGGPGGNVPPLNPMTFAAMMMGLPLPPGMLPGGAPPGGGGSEVDDEVCAILDLDEKVGRGGAPDDDDEGGIGGIGGVGGIGGGGGLGDDGYDELMGIGLGSGGGEGGAGRGGREGGAGGRDWMLDEVRERYKPRFGERLEGWLSVGRVLGVKGLVRGEPAVKAPNATATSNMSAGGAGGGTTTTNANTAGTTALADKGKAKEKLVPTLNVSREVEKILSRVYKDVVEKMPWMKAGDVASAMASKISDRPSKSHIANALEVLNTFCRGQRKKIAAANAKARAARAAKEKAAAAAAQGSATGATGTAGVNAARAPVGSSGGSGSNAGAGGNTGGAGGREGSLKANMKPKTPGGKLKGAFNSLGGLGGSSGSGSGSRTAAIASGSTSTSTQASISSFPLGPSSSSSTAVPVAFGPPLPPPPAPSSLSPTAPAPAGAAGTPPPPHNPGGGEALFEAVLSAGPSTGNGDEIPLPPALFEADGIFYDARVRGPGGIGPGVGEEEEEEAGANGGGMDDVD